MNLEERLEALTKEVRALREQVERNLEITTTILTLLGDEAPAESQPAPSPGQRSTA
jgi:hypothetical protein